jgi:CRISPR/Cas system-associated protein endoribonuclease Cas2
MAEDVRMPSFAEVAERRADGKVVELPEGIDAYQLLQMEYRGQIVLTYHQRQSAMKCVEFERPKLGVVATTNLTSDDFATMLDRAIARSQAKLIEHRGPKPSPAPIPPRGTARTGPVPDRRFRRA